MTEIIKTLDEQLNDELEEWRKLGAEPSPPPNTFVESVKLRALFDVLRSKEIITDDEMESAYQQAYIFSLREARKILVDMRREMITVPRMDIPKKLH